MSYRVLIAAIALAGAVFLATGRSAMRPVSEGEERTPTPAVGSRIPPAPPDVDLETIRDVFHFEEARRAAGGAGGSLDGGAKPMAGESTPAVTAGPRLVGLVRRGDRLLAALALEGDVVLLGRGDSAGGHTVVEVGEEEVRLRGPEGDERTLAFR